MEKELLIGSIVKIYCRTKPSLNGGVFYMSKNTYMNLFDNQEISIIFVKNK